jgi:phosphoserine phosphatase
VWRKQPKVYRQWQEQPENVCPPEGEMLEAADQRVRQAMLKLLKKHKEGIIGVCVPEPLLSLVRRFISHAELGNLWNPMNGHGRFEILEVQPEEVLVKG